MLTFKEGEVEWKALGEIGEVRMCKRILKSQTSSEGEIPFYKIGTFGKEPDSYISRKLFNEFKEKYLKLQKKYFVDFNNIDSSQKKLQETSEEDKEKPFKPIQAESKSETYKDDNKMNELLRKLLETKFGTSDELEILFGMKFSDDDAGEFNKILSLNSAPKSVDIKA